MVEQAVASRRVMPVREEYDYLCMSSLRAIMGRKC